MDTRLSSRSLILVLLMLFAVFTPALSPYEPPKEVLDEVEDETMKTGSGPIDVLDNVGDWRFGTTGEQKNYAIETTSGPNPITYIAGEYQNSISIGGISLSGSANSDGYIAAIDSDDSFSWAARVGGSGTNSVMGMDVGDAEEILVTGKFSGTAFFYNESSSTPAFSRTSQGGSDVFVGMLSDDGKWEWVATAGSSIDDQGVDVEINSDGTAFHVTGRIGNNTDFYDSGDSTSWQFPASITNGGLDVFAASLNGSGGWSWAYAGGGSGLESGAEIVEYTNPWMPGGGIYLCGKSESQGGATFGVHNVTFDSSTNNGVEDFFIAKVGLNGWEWASSGIGGGDTSCKDLAISSNGSSLAMTGSYRNSISYFDSRPWASAISVGAHYTCGIRDTGAATCWGYGAGGRLGNGGTANSDVPDLVDLPNGRTALEMSAGGHSCAVLDNGSAMCWGKGDYGRLGNGGTTASSTPVYVDLPAGRTAKTISSGYHHSCAVLDNGSAMCWGLGIYGQLGNGFNNNESTPVFVSLPAGRSATSITGGHHHTCAILDNGSAMCWGYGASGELGNSIYTQNPTNVPVYVNLPTGRTVTEISAGQDFSCGLLDNHSVMCWGSDGSGRLGNGDSTTSSQSNPVYSAGSGYHSYLSITTGNQHACAINSDGDVHCWGENGNGQLGSGDTNDEYHVGVSTLPAGSYAVAVDGGDIHTCAILNNAEPYCWGYNWAGQLGNGGADNYSDQLEPVAVSGSPSMGAQYTTRAGSCSTSSSTTTDTILVMQIDTSDGGFDWCSSSESTASGSQGKDITYDPTGNLTVTGAMKGTVTFTEATQNTLLTSTGNADAFLAGFSSSTGFVQWAKNSAWGSEDVIANEVLYDDNGHILLGGFFAGSMWSSGGAGQSSGGNDVWVARMAHAKEGCFIDGTDTNTATEWTNCVGTSKGSIDPQGVVVDPSTGLSYHTGTFQGTAVFGNHVLVSPKDSGTNVFVAAIDSAGVWQWAASGGGENNEYVRGIGLDSSGYLYVAGYYYDNTTFGAVTLTGDDSANTFVAKIAPSNRVWQWAASTSGTSGNSVEGFAVDSSGNSYITGGFSGTTSFGSTQSLTTNGQSDIYVAKLTSGGTWSWAKNAGSNLPDKGYGVAVDEATGSVYVTGSFMDDADFGSTSLTSAGGSDIFFAKLSSSGTWAWAKEAGSTSSDYGYDVVVDNATGKPIFTGYYAGSATFGSNSYSGSGSYTTFVVKMSASGAWDWITTTSGTSAGESITLGAAGSVFITGKLSGSATFGSDSISSTGGWDIWLGEVNATGSWIWAQNGGSTGSDYGRAIDSLVVSGSEYVWVSGSFEGEATFGQQTVESVRGTSAVFSRIKMTGADGEQSAANGTIDATLTWSAAANRLEGGWGATNLTFSPSYTYYFEWELTYQSNGSLFDSGQGDFTPTSAVHNEGVRVWYASTLVEGESYCYQVYLRKDSASGTLLDSDSSCYVVPVQEVFANSTPAWTSSNSLDTFSVAWGDVDGDGDLDLAVGNSAGNNEVYLNSGTALTTTPSWTSSNSLNTRSVAWGDVDGDGDLDLAVGNNGGNNEVYLNSGTALATTPAWTSSNSILTRSVAWGDVDGDGDLDLAVGNNGWQNEIYLNTGTALSTTPAWTSSNSLYTESVAWGDVDGDGDLDLAVGNSNENNEVYLNSGTALATTPAWTSSNNLNSYFVAWGDVDGDGDLDLAVANKNGNNEVYLNSGTALATTPAWTSSNSLDTISVAWGDVDGDGDLDLAVGNSGGKNEVYLNSGTALTTTPSWTSSNSLNTRSVAWGDVDGDGDLDLAVGNYYGNNEVYLNQFDNGGAVADYGEITVTLSYNESSEELEFRWDATELTAGAYYNVSWNFYEDVLGDPSYIDGSHPFISSANNRLESVWYWSLDHGGFDRGISPGDAVCFSTALYLGAIDDSIFSEDDGPFDEECITIPEGTSGNLSSTPFWQSQETDSINTLEWGDIDEDGDLDLVACTTSGDILVYLQGQTSLTLDERIQASDTGGRASCQLVDIDADGDLDIGVAIWGNNASIYKNDATGSFSHFDSFGENTINKAYSSISFADMNHDGYPDAFLTRYGETDHLFWNYNGVGMFQEDPDWASDGAHNGRDSAWGDFDDDGDMDIAIANEGAGIEVYYNTGSSLPQYHSWVTSTMTTWDVDWVDIDLDGDLDLIAGVNGKDLVYFNENNVLSSTSIELVGDVTRRTNSLDYGDVDGDGDLDIVTAGDDNNIELYLNELTSVQSKWVLEHGSFVVALGDVDGDGDLDLAVGGYSNGPTKIFLNDWDNGGAGADGLPDLEGSDDTGSDEPDGCQLPDNTVSLWDDGVDRLYILYNFNFVLDSFEIDPVPSQSIDYDDDTIVGGEWFDAGHHSFLGGATGLIAAATNSTVGAFDGTCGTLLVIELDMNSGDQFPNNLSWDFDENAGFFDGSGTKMSVTFQEWSDPPSLHSEMTWDAGNQEFDVYVDIYDLDTSETYNFDWELWVFEGQQITSGSSTIGSGTPSPAEMVYSFQDSDYSFNNGTDYCFWMQLELGGNDLVSDEVCARFPGSGGAGGSNVSWGFYDYCYFDVVRKNPNDEDGLYWCGEDEDEADLNGVWWYWCEGTPEGAYQCTDDYGHGNQPDNGTGNQTQQEPNPTLNVEFKEESSNECEEGEIPCVDGVDGIFWLQDIEIELTDSWIGYNHSVSIKLYDSDDNTLYSYFSPIDDADGWKNIGEESTYSDLSIELTDDDTWEFWQGSTRYVTIMDNNEAHSLELPYFEAGEYCVEISLGYQINSTDTPMGSVKNLFDKEVFCGTFEHDAFEGIIWDGMEEEEKGLVDRLTANPIVSKILDFMESTTGQIVSILLGILAFAGRMVLARGQRAKNKRVRKFAQRIRKAETVGRLKIIEQDVEKANDKNKLPRGGYGDLMEQIEARLEKLGFDENPQDGGTSGDWSSNDGADEWQDDFQQAADMMWETQDMMADAREDASMARQAIEDMQQQLGLDGRYGSEPEPEKKHYERTGLRLSDTSKSAGPSLPSSKFGDGGAPRADDLVSSILSKNIAPKDPCHCGSKKMYKDCHMKRDKARRGRR